MKPAVGIVSNLDIYTAIYHIVNMDHVINYSVNKLIQ